MTDFTFDMRIVNLMAAYGGSEPVKQRREFPRYQMISVMVPKKKVDSCLYGLRKLGIDGYMFFYNNSPYKKGYENIYAIKTNDKYDILRAFDTNGINHDITNEDVIARLKEWDKLYTITIYGAALDFVDIEFNYITKGLGEFSKEIYEFCPDCVDQCLGDMDALEESLDLFSRVFLWWD